MRDVKKFSTDSKKITQGNAKDELIDKIKSSTKYVSERMQRMYYRKFKQVLYLRRFDKAHVRLIAMLLNEEGDIKSVVVNPVESRLKKIILLSLKEGEDYVAPQLKKMGEEQQSSIEWMKKDRKFFLREFFYKVENIVDEDLSEKDFQII